MGAVDSRIPVEAHHDLLGLELGTGHEIYEFLGFFGMSSLLGNDKVHGLTGHSRLGQDHPGLRIELAFTHEGEKHVHPYGAHPDLAPVEGIEGPYVAGGDSNIFVELTEVLEGLFPGIHLGLLERPGDGVLIPIPCLPIHPAHGKGHPGHAALDAVVAELSRIVLDPLYKLFVALGRIFHIVGIVGQNGLTVEHRNGIAFDIHTEGVLREGGSDVLPVGKILGVGHEEIFLHGPLHEDLVHHGHVHVPVFLLGPALRFDLFVDALRSGIARTGMHRQHRDFRILLRKLRGNDVLPEGEHVHITGGHVHQLDLLRFLYCSFSLTTGQRQAADEQKRKQERNELSCLHDNLLESLDITAG